MAGFITTKRFGLATLGLAALALAAAAPTEGAERAAPLAAGGAEERFTLDHWQPNAQELRGRAVYERWCIGCHGAEGRGDGPSAEWLEPRPRNFHSGNYKFRSTPSGELPVIEDVVHVIHNGLNGSAMRSFPLMPENEKRDVAAYVLSLSEFAMVAAEVNDLIEDDDMTLAEVLEEEYEEVYEEAMELAWEDAWPVTVDQRPEMDEDSIANGRELYEAQCVACHGSSGRGDGESSYALRDYKDSAILPRDLTTGVYRAGSRPKDLFLRMRTGLNGTPMPAISGSDDDLWDLTHYLLSLKAEDAGRWTHPLLREGAAR